MNKFFFACFLLIAQLSFAQTAVNTSATGSAAPAFKFPQLDKSPMDMAYYPANYPVLRIQDKASEPLLARVIYSRPQKKAEPFLVNWWSMARCGVLVLTKRPR